MSVVIQVENLSKYYRLGVIGGGTLREDLNRWWAKARGRPDPLLKIGETDHGNRVGGELWALRDVSFQVREGEILGIIGRNGAGKSSLLKILSRITAPTTGQVKIKGRVGSLLEVGTGFHPELTGRENIYLNGAILGMKKAEIDGKLDEIIDFAEIEQFIDTPVKRYSSGMYVRLAFAVAAHLEPEILVVDEVLAVGDVQFQKKCLGKMGEVARGGRTVLFVSHNMGAVSALCSTGLLLKHGTVAFTGDTENVVEAYLGGGEKVSAEQYWNEEVGDKAVRLISGRLKNEKNEITSSFGLDEAIFVEIEYDVRRTINNARVGFRLASSNGTIVFTSENTDTDRNALKLNKGLYTSRAKIPGNFLSAESYSITLGCHVPMVEIIFLEEDCLRLEIKNTGGVGGFVDDKRRGLIRPKLDWQNSYSS